MDGRNPYDSILSHALKGKKEETNQAINVYRDELVSRIDANYRRLSPIAEFPYCTCSLPEDRLDKAVEIEKINVAFDSMHINILTKVSNTNKPQNKQESILPRKQKIRREVIILKCKCTEKKQIDWSESINIKLLGLLTDYAYKTLSHLMLISDLVDPKNEIENEEKEEEGLHSEEIVEYLKKNITDIDTVECLTSGDTEERSDLLAKILRESRQKK
ncbi:hypothetical protein NEIG_00569 [Nematocida sp. ERTm5]|nr:hypothetical protein NEIG_00569 [Nematocida sp. ERTm5]